jgi:hypothetical protein
MKKNYKQNALSKLFNSNVNFAIMVVTILAFSCGSAYSQQSYTFTSAGATGRLGPTQAQLNTAYATTNLNGLVTSAAGIQTMVVPASGAYRIELLGASGGTNAISGLGARVIGEVNLTAGSTLRVLVGQMGSTYATSNSDGGGGGSFVAENSTLLAAAGAGGGAAQNSSPSQNASLSQTTSNNAPSLFGSQGAGATANGVTFTWGPFTTVAQSFTNGGNGQAGGQAGGWPGSNYGDGGFGGGGSSCSCSTGGGGGCGGYTGGGGGGNAYNTGTGGSSFIIGVATNTAITQLTSFGNGRVIITALCNVNISGPTTICAGQTTTLTSSAVSNYSWSTGSTSSVIVVSPSVTTNYTATGTGSQNNCSSSILITVNVNQLPTISGAVQLPIIPSTSAASVLCVGSSATLTALGATSYTWVSGPSTAVRVVSPTTTTTYSMSGTSAVGCVNTGFVTVNVNTLNVSASSATVCSGSPAVLNASGGNPNIAAPYNWINAGQFQTITISNLAATTVYTVTGVDNNFCTTSATAAVVVNPLPNVTVSADKTTICAGEKVNLTASGAQSYSWTPANTGAAISATLLVDVPTPFSVVGTDNNGCKKSAAVTINVVRCTGVNALQLANANISVYPNPSNGYFTIKSDVALTLTISNELGQVVKAVSLNEGNKNEVNINNLATGIYFIKGENNGYVVNQKILITQ